MKATKLTGTVYFCDNGALFLEFYNPEENVFEYYLKDINSHDFDYKFGVTEAFSVKQLIQLYEQGYFD